MTSRRHQRQPRFDTSDSLLDGPAITLDLHGDTVSQARDRVVRFVQANAQAHRGALLHIISGKGKHSGDGARLRPAVRALLQGACRPYVEDFDVDVDGGGYRVRLKR